jgi:hypothetical protein
VGASGATSQMKPYEIQTADEVTVAATGRVLRLPRERSWDRAVI